MWILWVGLAGAVDHQLWQQVLDASLREGRVDYAALKVSPTLAAYLTQLAVTPPSALVSPQEATAFYLNAYNALTVAAVARAWPIQSIRDLDGGAVWTTQRFPVAGALRTLQAIEDDELRRRGDPRVHAALNCASLGCPPLAAQAFTATQLDAQLDAASRVWARSAVLKGQTLWISEIFSWYGGDFVQRYSAPDRPGVAGAEEAALNFLALYNPTLAAPIQSGVKVAYTPYDWRVNAR